MSLITINTDNQDKIKFYESIFTKLNNSLDECALSTLGCKDILAVGAIRAILIINGLRDSNDSFMGCPNG